MYSFLNKHGQMLAFGLGVLITVIFFGTILSSSELDSVGPQMGAEAAYNTSLFDFGLGVSILLTVLAAAAMVIFGVSQMAGNIKGSMKGLLGLALVAALMFVAYASSPAEADHPTIEKAINTFESSQGTELSVGNLKFIGGAITTALVLLAASFAALIGFGIRSIFQ